MRIHMVAIGGSVMHNLALDLAAAGHQVSGSDDEFYEPSKSRLADAGLLPSSAGWDPARIFTELDCVIAGMHAKADNPEISKAMALGIKIYSFPEFFGVHAQNKVRLVIAGSHGKTTTTAMIMHAMQSMEKDFDYLVGASLEGFERNVRLSNAPLCVIEGDEYPSSPLDLRPKIMHYHPDIVIITGIAWDHMNVFPTWEGYKQVFRDFISGLRDDALVIWYHGDQVLQEIINMHQGRLRCIAYEGLQIVPSGDTKGENAGVVIIANDTQYTLRVFGSHNLQNMAAAALACAEVGIDQHAFFSSMESFGGAAMRLQDFFSSSALQVFRDFAHAPSKVRATTRAVRERFPDAFIVACFELHTYSSLNAEFLPQYKETLDAADHAMIFYSPKTLEIKRMQPISPGHITKAFVHPSLEVMTSKKTLEERLQFFRSTKEPTVILLMSSGRFENADLSAIFSDQE